ncbi:TIGR03618 family F420-dependent PPOX class oxidoreductase [Streptomyces sp. B1866]|uniref:pyridoxamine 5'-phosphate oxidase family protein n=1 Tax=Streptomyces sp. B1866 TaxID=3075431 RepID=UPI002891D33C|nr:TIGR03618 family F420-dependent PPOX class oxidoreductase [Streptomyces sp. B1866]MDT3397768.1 TIGR03618 family F420-dependent PPOX class oxidoreductase [Streptomyces sp. B1866]
MAVDLRDPPPEYLAFWRERHVCTLTVVRPDGTPHVAPVGVTYDPEGGVARVLARRDSRKAAHVAAAGAAGAPVAVCQVAPRRWATLEGRAAVVTDPAAIADAEDRYAERYGRAPAPRPDRVLLLITLTRAMGRTYGTG